MKWLFETLRHYVGNKRFPNMLSYWNMFWQVNITFKVNWRTEPSSILQLVETSRLFLLLASVKWLRDGIKVRIKLLRVFFELFINGINYSIWRSFGYVRRREEKARYSIASRIWWSRCSTQDPRFFKTKNL